ncbi:MAG: Rnase Y domain-containing protein, partial [Bacteroidota bacterium]
MPPPILIPVAVALAFGIAAGYYLRYLYALSQKSSLELEIKERALEAETKATEIVQTAEEKAEQLKKETKAECQALTEKLQHKEGRLEKKEELLDERQIDVDSQIENVRTKIDQVKSLKEQLDDRTEELDHKFEVVAGLSQEEAFEQIVGRVERERQADLENRFKKLERQGEEQFEGKAQNILLAAIHRIGNNLPTNIMTASVELPSDDLKGKVIGKEGRNVRTFERLTGVDVLVDDTPGYIVLSSFDPIRREIARVALETLVKDGRIQPAKIEESVEHARKTVAETVKKMGEKASYEASVPN